MTAQTTRHNLIVHAHIARCSPRTRREHTRAAAMHENRDTRAQVLTLMTLRRGYSSHHRQTPRASTTTKRVSHAARDMHETAPTTTQTYVQTTFTTSRRHGTRECEPTARAVDSSTRAADVCKLRRVMPANDYDTTATRRNTAYILRCHGPTAVYVWYQSTGESCTHA